MTTQEISGNSLYKKLKSITLGGTTCLYSEEKCNYYAPLINQINALKKEDKDKLGKSESKEAKSE
eukprot:COSAG06_NODE_18219_length_898_cov_0.877347_1_plen_65_part_00